MLGRAVHWLEARAPRTVALLAAARHGDLPVLEQSRDAVRSTVLHLRGRHRPGYLPEGRLSSPYPARPVTSFDAHAWLDRTAALVTDVLDAARLPYVRAPRRTGERHRIVVAAAQRQAVARALEEHLTDRDAQVRGLTADGTRGGDRPASAGSVEYWLGRGGLRLFVPVASRGGLLLAGPELGCDVEAWEKLPVRGGNPAARGPWLLQPPWPNDWAPYLSRETWAESAARPERRPPPLSTPTIYESREPVDLVYTWVDGDDPDWLATKARIQESERPDVHESATHASRFDSHDELRYSLRSVGMYAGWIRRIFIVTDQQTPEWLDVDHPQITVVDHREIFPPDAALPTYNSHAIESRLHRIPGLAEKYLYLNDDVFFGRPVSPHTFFFANGIAKFFPSSRLLDLDPPTPAELPIDSAGKNNRELLRERFDASVAHKFKHTPHPQLKSVVEQMEQENPELFAQLLHSRFRSASDYSIASALHHYYAFALGRAVPADDDYFYLDLAQHDVERQLNGLLRTRQFQMFCINDVMATPAQRGRSELFRRFLEDYFPLPSPYEIPVR